MFLKCLLLAFVLVLVLVLLVYNSGYGVGSDGLLQSLLQIPLSSRKEG